MYSWVWAGGMWEDCLESLAWLVPGLTVFDFIGGRGGGDWAGRGGETELTGGDFDGVWYRRRSLGDDLAGLNDERDLFGDFVCCIFISAGLGFS